ncbi:hypothetical protein D0C36_15430 [Mucilaginibacter conchicola]|uniref:TonB C-terminal domain-containing protein n=1 Tax=Mucilaginibacter conchicola TaxID=2303333 RepID=A0A372NVY5_9SPHI|nr:hypothetical protein [Mucilaginibacter conchicola]RFZ92787.1 hypothetical protein D0C36_15430 [Mucilaginibacter conchicola]
MKRILFLIVSISAFIVNAKAQMLTNEQIADRVRQSIRKNYKPDTAELLKVCKQALVFVKFEVNKQGIINNITFSNDSTKFVEDALRTAVKALQNDRPLMNTLKKLNKAVVQPFVYSYLHSCSFPSLKQDTVSNDEARMFATKISRVFMHRNIIQQTLLNMINFNGKDQKVIDCLLLKPYDDYFIDMSH